jgi:hypothetical protein
MQLLVVTRLSTIPPRSLDPVKASRRLRGFHLMLPGPPPPRNGATAAPIELLANQRGRRRRPMLSGHQIGRGEYST